MQGVVPCRLEKMKMTAKKKSVKKSVKKLPVKRYPIDDDFLLAIITKVFGDILNQGVRRPRNATV